MEKKGRKLVGGVVCAVLVLGICKPNFASESKKEIVLQNLKWAGGKVFDGACYTKDYCMKNPKQVGTVAGVVVGTGAVFWAGRFFGKRKGERKGFKEGQEELHNKLVNCVVAKNVPGYGNLEFEKCVDDEGAPDPGKLVDTLCKMGSDETHQELVSEATKLLGLQVGTNFFAEKSVEEIANSLFEIAKNAGMEASKKAIKTLYVLKKAFDVKREFSVQEPENENILVAQLTKNWMKKDDNQEWNEAYLANIQRLEGELAVKTKEAIGFKRQKDGLVVELRTARQKLELSEKQKDAALRKIKVFEGQSTKGK